MKRALHPRMTRQRMIILELLCAESALTVSGLVAKTTLNRRTIRNVLSGMMAWKIVEFDSGCTNPRCYRVTTYGEEVFVVAELARKQEKVDAITARYWPAGQGTGKGKVHARSRKKLRDGGS